MKSLVKKETLDDVSAVYPVAVAPALLQKCRSSLAMAAQFVPSIKELDRESYELDDPIGDQKYSPVAGIVHRYPDRVLLFPVGNCPSYCRFCFRKQFVGRSTNLDSCQLNNALDYIRSRKEVREVILSGGEPLMLVADALRDLLEQLAGIEHVDTIRIHTRLPVTAPELAGQFNEDIFVKLSKPVYMVLHCNHPDEIDADFSDFCKRMRQQGVILLSQSVLLKGINASAEILEKLFRKLLRNGVKPYYLHHLDRAPGTSHFRVSIADGRRIMRSLRGKVSGIALPTYILDLPGGDGKVPAESEWISEVSLGEYQSDSPCSSQKTVYSDWGR